MDGLSPDVLITKKLSIDGLSTEALCNSTESIKTNTISPYLNLQD